jgi:hypothetical protein
MWVRGWMQGGFGWRGGRLGCNLLARCDRFCKGMESTKIKRNWGNVMLIVEE